MNSNPWLENQELTLLISINPKKPTKGLYYMALTFGTLLSSQGTDAHRTRPHRALVDSGFSCTSHNGSIHADLPVGPESGVSRGASRTLHHPGGPLHGGSGSR